MEQIDDKTKLQLIAFSLIQQNTMSMESLYNMAEDTKELTLIAQAYTNGVMDMESATARAWKEGEE